MVWTRNLLGLPVDEFGFGVGFLFEVCCLRIGDWGPEFSGFDLVLKSCCFGFLLSPGEALRIVGCSRFRV
jgi:hypothetical protein